jgi:hypothetical protein
MIVEDYKFTSKATYKLRETFSVETVFNNELIINPHDESHVSQIKYHLNS